MTFIPLLAVGFIMKAIAVLFVLSALSLILIVLIQKGKGGGLSGALAGGMASGILGAKTGDFLTWFTISLVSLFLILAVIMAKFYRPTVSNFGETQETTVPMEQPQPQPQPKPVVPAVPAPTDNTTTDTNK